MSTTHEYCEHIDCTAGAAIFDDCYAIEEPDYHEQVAVMQDFIEHAEAEHRRQGAEEALESVERWVLTEANKYRECKVFEGLSYVLHEVERRLADLKSEGGAI